MSSNRKSQMIRVRTQRIPWRLSDCQNLSMFQGLCVLKGICNGCSQLLSHYPRPFFVSHDMIGMSIHGTVRVWLNSNFCENKIAFEDHKFSSVSTMMENIIKILQEKLYQKKFPMRCQLLNCHSLSWMTAKVQSHLKNFSQDRKKACRTIMQRCNNRFFQQKELRKLGKIKAQLSNLITNNFKFSESFNVQSFSRINKRKIFQNSVESRNQKITTALTTEQNCQDFSSKKLSYDASFNVSRSHAQSTNRLRPHNNKLSLSGNSNQYSNRSSYEYPPKHSSIDQFNVNSNFGKKVSKQHRKSLEGFKPQASLLRIKQVFTQF